MVSCDSNGINYKSIDKSQLIRLYINCINTKGKKLKSKDSQQSKVLNYIELSFPRNLC